MKLDHIGMAVNSVEDSKKFFEKLLSCKFSEIKEVDFEKVRVSFSEDSHNKIELVEATSENSPRFSFMPHPITSFIEKNGEGIQHMCFEVDDISVEIERLKDLGVKAIDKEPHIGGEGCKVTFLNPKNTKGILIELKEKNIAS